MRFHEIDGSYAAMLEETLKHDPRVFRDVSISHDGGIWKLPKAKLKAAWTLDKRRERALSQGYDDARASRKHIQDPEQNDADDYRAISAATYDTGHLNQFLRHGPGKDQSYNAAIEKQIETLSSVIANRARPLLGDIHVYHGTNLDPSSIAVDGVFTINTFISTTRHPMVALRFGTAKTDDEGRRNRHVIHFHLPKGFDQGIDAYSYKRSDECEFLIQKGTSWRIINHEIIRRKFTAHSVYGERAGKVLLHLWTVVPA